jgi:hypothetical protein
MTRAKKMAWGATVLTISLLTLGLSGCGQEKDNSKNKLIAHVSERDASGGIAAFWIYVTIPAGHPAGEPAFRQTDLNGNPTEGWSVMEIPKDGMTYEQTDKTYSLRISNVSNCPNPCGYFRAWICPSQNKTCRREEALKDFGIADVPGWEVSLDKPPADPQPTARPAAVAAESISVPHAL